MATETTAPTDAEIQRALKFAHGVAANRTRGSIRQREAAIDAGTDSVVWSVRNWNSANGGSFLAFASAAAKTWIHRAIVKERHRYATSPNHVELFEGIPSRQPVGTHETGLSLDARNLPDDLRDVVRLFFVDRFDVREISLLTGVSFETVRARLRRAAKLLAGDETHVDRLRRAGEKRMTH